MYEQTGGAGFSPEYIEETRKETIDSLMKHDDGIDWIVGLVKSRIIALREEFAEKWDVPEEKKNPDQEFHIMKRTVSTTDIDILCDNTAKFIKGINSIMPLSVMLNERRREQKEDMLHESCANERQLTLAVLPHIRSLIVGAKDIMSDVKANAVRIISAMEYACGQETGTYSGTSAIVRTQLFSFLKSMITADHESFEEIHRVHKIGTSSLRNEAGMLTHGWWNEGPVCVTAKIITPSIMISMVGGKRCERFDTAFNLFLESTIVHRK